MRSIIEISVKRNKKEESLKKIKSLKVKIYSIIFILIFLNFNTENLIFFLIKVEMLREQCKLWAV